MQPMEQNQLSMDSDNRATPSKAKSSWVKPRLQRISVAETAGGVLDLNAEDAICFQAVS